MHCFHIHDGVGSKPASLPSLPDLAYVWTLS
jgi:hypothetical protein